MECWITTNYELYSGRTYIGYIATSPSRYRMLYHVPGMQLKHRTALLTYWESGGPIQQIQ